MEHQTLNGTIALRDYQEIDPRLAQIQHYWNALRRPNGLPSRAEIQPFQLGNSLQHSFILQRTDTGSTRVRFAGQTLQNHLGLDPRGMPFPMFFHAAVRDQVSETLMAVLTKPCTLRCTLETEQATFQMLMLPMTDQTGAATRILGGIVVTAGSDQAARAQFRFQDGKAFCCHPVSHVNELNPLPRGLALQNKRPHASRPALRLIVDNTAA